MTFDTLLDTFEDALEAAIREADDEAQIVPEPTHTADDEAFYVADILPGWYDEAHADAEPEFFGDEWIDTYEADRAQDRWERSFWGD